MVRLKFKVLEKTELEGGAGSVKLGPVYSGSEENKKFYHFTPSGGIHFTTINQEALSQFKVGQEFYVDLTPAPVPEETPPAGAGETQPETSAS